MGAGNNGTTSLQDIAERPRDKKTLRAAEPLGLAAVGGIVRTRAGGIMAKFGGLLGGGSGKSGKDDPDAGARKNAVVVSTDATSSPPAPAVSSRLPRVGTAPAFAILLDATGSMAPSIADARDQIGEILTRVRAQLRRSIQVQFFCYRDYDVLGPVLSWATFSRERIGIKRGTRSNSLRDCMGRVCKSAID